MISEAPQKGLEPWCSAYHFCTTLFNKAWNQVLHRFKSCSQHVGDSRWYGSLAMVPVGNKDKCFSLVNHITKTKAVHHHHLLISTVIKTCNKCYKICLNLKGRHRLNCLNLKGSTISRFERIFNKGGI